MFRISSIYSTPSDGNFSAPGVSVRTLKNGFITALLCLCTAFRLIGGESSVMASGNWYRMTIDRDGVYRITYSELVNLGISDPAHVRIYGSGGAMLPERADEHSGDNLKEIPIAMYTGNDGVFNNGDHILFYGQGPTVWRYDQGTQTFEHATHLWDNTSCYFITSKAGGKRIEAETPPSEAPSHTVTTFDEHQYYEAELTNIVRSGRQWYGEDFRENTTPATTRRFPFTVPDIETGSAAWLHVAFMAQTSSSATRLDVSCGGHAVADQPLPVSPSYQVATAMAFNTAAFLPSSGDLPVELTITRNGVDYSGGWLDYIRLFARRRLNMASSQLFFRDTQSTGAGHICNFRITGCNANTQVWDITDMHRIRRMDATLDGNTLSFRAKADDLREYVAFDMASNLPEPVFPEREIHVANQNLHGMEGVEMVVVTHPDLMDAAQELATLHRNRDAMTVEVVTAAQVYNEFSSGMQDPAAIRNLMKHLHEQPGSRTKYLLLLGDGSYNNRSIGRRENNTHYMVTYQSENSCHSTNSFVSDDYFGILGSGETVETGTLSIGVGRIPAQTAAQAQEAVEKIRRYIDARTAGDWPNLIGLLADDEDANLHVLQSETLATNVATHQPQYTVEKLYSDAFVQTTTADGHRYPDVEKRLDNLLNRGCLLVNYIGHGNESGLSAERVINTTHIGQWTNRIYPLFVVATCEFGRYDNDARITAGESVLMHPSGGGIAVLTSTRLVYSSMNFVFNQNFVHELLNRSDSDDDHRLGDILRRAKNASEASINKLCFTLLGDPALKPVIPTGLVHTVAINGKPVNEPLDTLKANSNVVVKGKVTDADGQLLTGFNGVLYLTLFDKAQQQQTLNNDSDVGPIGFTTQTSTLYKGKATVANGTFEQSFVIPRDINYKYGLGKMSYYACSDDGQVAAGAFEIKVGGSVPGKEDTDAPTIRLFMNDTLFRDGGITDQSPRLIARLRDEHGINTSDEGIGHNLTAVFRHDPSTVYILNPYYEADLDNHHRGVVNYRFTHLPAGNYEMLFTAWDLANNSSQESIRFRVMPSTTLQIDQLYNYPNPFTARTRIYFEFNMPDTDVQVELQVYDLSGRLLRTFLRSLYATGYTSGNFEWDGYDAGGNRVRSGIYPYRVVLRTANGQTAWQASKMMLGN